MSWLIAVLVLAILIPFLDMLLTPQKDPREPPWIPSKIPLIGHVVGLLREKNRYYTRLCTRHGRRIYSLALATGRVYVVGAPELVAEMQRQPKKISFWLIAGHFTARLGGMSAAFAARLVQDDQSLMLEGLRAIHAALVPDKLDPMIREATSHLSTLTECLPQEAKLHGIDLWDWTQNAITIATTNAVYGPQNPYRDPLIARGFWEFIDATVPLIAGFMPSVFARKGYRGRERLVSAFQDYFAGGRAPESASTLTKARVKTLLDSFDSVEVAARSETVNGIALLSNTVPTAFWAIFHMLSTPGTLAKVREALSQAIDTTHIGDEDTVVISLRRLLAMPIFDSLVRESLRHRTSGIGPRMVVQDISLENDRYLLKKGAVVIIPNSAMHRDESVWGETVDEFWDQRFMSEQRQQKIHPAAFRGFGGGANRCPGKTFATAEITVLLAMLAAKYDVTPIKGQWEEPFQDTSNMSSAIAPPKLRVLVTVKPRTESRKHWKFEL